MRRAVLLATLLLLASTAAAAGPVALQAGRLDWTGEASGPFVVLAAVGGSEPPRLSLSAQSLDVAWDESTVYAQPAGGPAVSVFPTSSSQSFGAASLEVTGARAGWVAYVLPLGDGRAQTGCGSATAATDLTREAPVNVDRNRAQPVADTSAAIAAGPGPACPTPAFHVQGDVQVVLWELDGAVSTPDGTAPLQSGHYSANAAREYFIEARGADLTFQGTPEAPGALYVTALDVTSDALTLHDARGNAAGAAVDSSSAVLRGPLMDAHVERVGSGLSLAAHRATRLEIDGSAIRLDPPRPMGALWWLLTVPLVAGGWWLRRDSTSALERRVRRLVHGDEPGAAAAGAGELDAQVRAADIIRLSSRILERAPGNAEIHFRRGESYLLLNRFEESLADLEAAAASREWQPVAAVGRALALSALRRDQEALEALRWAYVADPRYVWHAMQEVPELRRLWGAPDSERSSAYH